MEIADVTEGEVDGEKTNFDAQMSLRRNKRGQDHRKHGKALKKFLSLTEIELQGINNMAT